MFRIVESETGRTVEIAASRAAAEHRSDWLTLTTRIPHHVVLTPGVSVRAATLRSAG